MQQAAGLTLDNFQILKFSTLQISFIPSFLHSDIQHIEYCKVPVLIL